MVLIKTNMYRFYYLVSVFCGFYIYGFFPAPYYLLLIAGFCSLFLSKTKTVDVNILTIMCIIALYMFFLLTYSKVNVWSYYFIGLVIFFSIVAFRDNLNFIQKNIITKKTITFSIFLVLLDTFYRFEFPRADYLVAIEGQGRFEYMFYGYKHSFLFQDSNFVGLFMLSIFFLFRDNMYLYKKKGIVFFVLIVLIILSFSRAAIVALIVTECIRLFCKARIDVRLKIIIAMVMALPIILVVVDLVNHVNDESFESKFMLLHKFISTVEQRDLYELMFGWGLDNTRDHWGIAAHSLFNTMIVEMGFLGTVLIALAMLYCWRLNRKTTFHFIGLSVACLSFGLIFTPFFVPLALNIIMRDVDNESELL